MRSRDEVMRYSPFIDEMGGDDLMPTASMYKHKQGAWVKYEDYSRMADRIRELEAQQVASEPVACPRLGACFSHGCTCHPSAAAVTPCEWKLDDPDFSLYHTDCGNDFTLNEDGPVENRMAFCCYCGKPMKAQRIRPTTPTRGSDETV